MARQYEKENEEHLIVVNAKQTYPIIIIGGGPAGLATSLTLAFRGINHCIVDASTKVAPKPGEAIPPNARPLLRQLGIEHLLENQQHLPYHGNKSCWGTDHLDVKDHISEVHGHGYLLNRTQFESSLQGLVKNKHVPLFSGYRLKKLHRVGEGVEVMIDNGTKTLTLSGQFVIDATGRKASVCRHMTVQKQVLDNQFAVIMELEGNSAIGKQIWVEACAEGWWYVAPLGGNRLSLMFFTLQHLLPNTDLPQYLDQIFRNTQYLSNALTIPDFKQLRLKIRPAGTSFLQKPYGKQWLAVGDAAYSYDPISSYGITSALAGGYYAGHALADFLHGKTEALASYRYLTEQAFHAYLLKLEQHYELEQRWSNHRYWTERFPYTLKT